MSIPTLKSNGKVSGGNIGTPNSGESTLQDRAISVISQLEKDSNKSGVRNKVKYNGGTPDGLIGRNDLQAIIKYGAAHGVAKADINDAKILLNVLNNQPSKVWLRSTDLIG